MNRVDASLPVAASEGTQGIEGVCSPSCNWPWCAALAGLMLLAFACRVPQLHESLWLDELHTSWVVSGNFGEVVERAAVGNQAVLYYLLMWCVSAVLGGSEAVLRGPSIVAGVLLIPAVFLLSRCCGGGRPAALGAATLAACDPLAMFYGLEARPYAMVQLTAALQLATLARQFVQPTSLGRLVLVVLSASLFHLHYTTALLLFAEGALWGGLVWRIPHIRYQPRQAFRDAALVLVCSIPAWGHLEEILKRRQLWGAFVPRFDFESTLREVGWDAYLFWPMLLLCGVLLWRQFFLKPAKNRAESDGPNSSVRRSSGVYLLLLLFAGTVPGFVAWLSTAADFARLYFPRYLVATAPALWAIGGVAAGVFDSPRLRLLMVVVLTAGSLVAIAPDANWWRDGRIVARPQEDWRGAIAWLNDAGKGNPHSVILLPELIELQWEESPANPLFNSYLQFPLHGIYPLLPPGRPVVTWDTPLPEGEFPRGSPELKTENGVWMVIRRGPESVGTARRALEEWLAVRHRDSTWTLEQREFGGVTVVRAVPH